MTEYVTTRDALAAFLDEVRPSTTVAVDTEAASFHRYRDRIFLVQLSTGARTAIVDPLEVRDLSPLGAFLEDQGVEKLFHDADYDLRTLDRDYGFHAKRLFDTRIAAQLAGEPAIGLAALLERYVGVNLAKVHQKADWSQRPLPAAMLDYAADDVRHLPTLRRALVERLRALGRLPWAEEEFRRLEGLRWTAPGDDSTSYLRAKGAKRLEPRQLAVLGELWRWRQAVAEREDKALFRIIGNDALLEIARAIPRDLAALERVTELPTVLARRHGAALLAAISRAMAVPERDLPRLERGPPMRRDPEFDERLERLKAARNTLADTLGVDPGVLCGRAALEAVARAAPKDRAALARIAELRGWQVDSLGDALLAALR